MLFALLSLEYWQAMVYICESQHPELATQYVFSCLRETGMSFCLKEICPIDSLESVVCDGSDLLC